ncbi:MAG: small ribosomal subunit Rsm22 family protein, partial [Dongiaceae bacterium]
MELPPTLRQAVDRTLTGIALADLAQAASLLSRRYRAEIRDGNFHLADDMAALAYLATRLPATYAAIRAAMTAAAERLPDFAPRSLLDVGAGPGSALWAASDTWPDLDDALLIEGSAAIRGQGEKLAIASSVSRIAWRDGDVTGDWPALLPAGSPSHDLVTLAYVLDELAPPARDRLVERLWAATGGLLLLVEPGTPAGWERILAARQLLIAAGAVLVAPCPHAA